MIRYFDDKTKHSVSIIVSIWNILFKEMSFIKCLFYELFCPKNILKCPVDGNVFYEMSFCELSCL